MTAIHIDTDNGLGSPRGDVDDGFAIAAMLAGQFSIAGITSVSGNTSSQLSYQNCVALAREFSYPGPVILGESSAKSNSAAEVINGYQEPINLLALGPLSNIAECLSANISNITLVGGNFTSKGRWPPLYPFEYNLTFDRQATYRVLTSDIPITIVPLDVAGRFRFTFHDLEQIPGKIGEFIRGRSKRWYRRALYLKWHRTVPIWDLLAAISLLKRDVVTFKSAFVKCHHSGWLEFSPAPKTNFRPVKVVVDFQKEAAWQHFLQLMASC